jgi:hypothetical protein
MDKGIGFRRNILLPWLDAAASYRSETDDVPEIRGRLDILVGQDIGSTANRRMAIDTLINIWVKSRSISPRLHDEALAHSEEAYTGDSRLWLHYGLILLAYPFFREVAAVIGQLARQGNSVTSRMVKRRLIASRGHLGSLEKAVERVIFSLRNWGLLENSGERYHYAPRSQVLVSDSSEVEVWLLACALRAHPAEELPFVDLVRLAELFAFRIKVGLGALRQSPHFAVDRQGGGWDSVRLAE